MNVLWQVENQHPVVSDRVFNRYLRYPPARTLEGVLSENAAWARTWFAAKGRPWFAAIRADDRVCSLVGTRFPDAAELAVIAVSAGPEAEVEAAARWVAGEPDRYYFLECFAAAVVESLLADARRRLGADRHLCPGYTGWPVTENALLLTALQAADALPGPLAVLPSGMLSPRKSQLAVCVLHPAPLPAR